jgi:hypothetical protein
MTSHEYAQIVKATAEHMLSRPEVEVDSVPRLYISFWSKEKFVSVVKAMGAGKKEFKSDDLTFIPDGTCLQISAPRNLVCRKIQEAKYVCEPLLTERELADLGLKQLEDSIF